MTSGAEWQAQVGRSWADMHAWTDRSFAGLTQRLLDRIEGRPGHAVLDLGCGAGELSLAIARKRPHAHVTGVDISADLVAVARERGAHLANVTFIEADASAVDWQGSAPDLPDVFDLVVSRHGVMFFADPAAAFAHIRNACAPGANLVFSCFRSPRENQWMSGAARALDGLIDPALLPSAAPSGSYTPGPFGFADPQFVEAVLAAAGWGQIDFEPVDYAYVAGMAADPVADALAMFARIGPAAPLLRTLDGAAHDEALRRIAAWAESHRNGDLVAFPAAAWIVTARNP